MESHHRALDAWYPCAGHFIFLAQKDGSIRATCERCGRLSPGWGEPESRPQQRYEGALSFAELAHALRVLKRNPAVLPGWYTARRDRRAARANGVGA